MRYVRAFFIALRMTIRGEQPEPRPYQPLIDWIKATEQQVDNVFKVAEQNGLDKPKRESIIVRADGRDQSMQTILAAVKYHTEQEYIYLLKNLTEHTITAIYASNMNDQYGVMRLAEAVQDPPTQAAIQQLSDQLQAIPPSNSL